MLRLPQLVSYRESANICGVQGNWRIHIQKVHNGTHTRAMTETEKMSDLMYRQPVQFFVVQFHARIESDPPFEPRLIGQLSPSTYTTAFIFGREQLGFSIDNQDGAICRVFVVPRKIEDIAPVIHRAIELPCKSRIVREHTHAQIERSRFQDFIVAVARRVIRGPVRTRDSRAHR